MTCWFAFPPSIKSPYMHPTHRLYAVSSPAAKTLQGLEYAEQVMLSRKPPRVPYRTKRDLHILNKHCGRRWHVLAVVVSTFVLYRVLACALSLPVLPPVSIIHAAFIGSIMSHPAPRQELQDGGMLLLWDSPEASPHETTTILSWQRNLASTTLLVLAHDRPMYLKQGPRCHP